MKQIEEISVFFPAYNEEANIKETVTKAEKVLNKIAEKYEIIVVDDGSKDNTSKIVKKLSKKNKKIKLIEHEKNKGYGAALISGFKNSKYKWIAFTDSDGQFDFTEIKKFIKTQNKTNADLVVGYYLSRKVSSLRKINTLMWQLVVKTIFGLNVKDIDCGFKLIRKKVIKTVLPLQSQRGAFISTEFLVKAQKNNFKIVEIPVHHYERKQGQPTGADLKVIVSSFIDLFKLWRRLR